MTETTINLTVIGDPKCSTTRTYLTYLSRAGLRPKQLWMIDFAPISRKRRLLQTILGVKLADAIWRHYRTPTVVRDETYAKLCMQLQTEAGLVPIDYFAPWDPIFFAEKVEYFNAANFHAPALQAKIAQANDTAFLYTNGGIVPAAVLELPGVRILHIHPGIVPQIRGSDCLLWSAAIRKNMGVSCFYMSPGIDEGSVIGQREFELPRLSSLAPLLANDEEPTAYRALLFAVDPHLRAQLLADVLLAHQGADLRQLPMQPQPKTTRPAYLWMHPRLRTKVLKEAFL